MAVLMVVLARESIPIIPSLPSNEESRRRERNSSLEVSRGRERPHLPVAVPARARVACFLPGLERAPRLELGAVLARRGPVNLGCAEAVYGSIRHWLRGRR